MAAKKDAYYFSHDANAQDDPKCMILIDQLGMEGYGIFWALIEKLRSEKDYKLPFTVLPSLARRWGTSKEKVESVVKLYSLFSVIDDQFFSERLLRSMNEKSEKARLSASYRWNNGKTDAIALQPHTDGTPDDMRNDAIKVKERKGKESKEVLPASKPEYPSEVISKFNSFTKWINDNAPRVNKLKKPFTIEEYLKVKEKIKNVEQLKTLLLKMQNWAPLTKNNESSYLTLLNWYERDNVDYTKIDDAEKKLMKSIGL